MDRTPSCLICSSSTKFYTKKNFHNYFKCPSCGLIFLYPSPTAAELNAYYGQEYFISDGSSKRGYDNYNLTIAFKRPFYEFLFFHLKALTPTAVLDVGAAYGDFVQFLKERGLNARGLEISDHAAAAARSRGLNVATSSLEDFAKTPLLPSGRQFDLVTALDVFEHFFNFEEALKSLEKLTASGGHLLIVTPNTKSLTARLLWKHWYQLNPPQHTALFNHENLKKFLAKHGFQVILSENIKKQFSIKYFLHTLGQWLGIKLPSSLYNWGGAKIFSFPFKDNMLVLAKKL